MERDVPARRRQATSSASSGTVTFPDGSPDNATQTITIPITDDLVPESTEKFSVALGAITGKPASQVSIESGKGTANADIAENDAVTVSVSGDARVTEGESATYTIALDSAASTQAITVDYTTTDKTALAGTGYTAASGTVTIPAGQTSATATVTTTENTDDEANRYFEFRMSNPQGGGGPLPMLSTTQFVNTTIVDDDGDPSSVVLTVDKTSFGESESAGTVNVTATLEGGTLAQNAIVAVTLGGTATKGSSGDYTATTLGNITITANQSSGTGSFTVTPVNDQVVEGDETVLLQGASAGLDVTPATITITDSDTATLGITGPSVLVSEGSSAEFTVTLSHAVASPGRGSLVGWLHCPDTGICRRLLPGLGERHLPGRLGCGGHEDHNHGHRRRRDGRAAGNLHRNPGECHRRPVLPGVRGLH